MNLLRKNWKNKYFNGESMKFINASYEIIPSDIDIRKKVEMAGRICYKSEGNITENSFEEFIPKLIKREHYSVLEHAQIIFIFSRNINILDIFPYKYINEYKFLNFTFQDNIIISGNAVSWRDLFVKEIALELLYELLTSDKCKIFFSDLQYLINNKDVGFLEYSKFKLITGDNFNYYKLSVREKLNHGFVSVKIITDKGVTHEAVRHRPISPNQESTRFCNYNTDKFDHQLSFINTDFFNDEKMVIVNNILDNIEKGYNRLIELGSKPQEARYILPHGIKTEIIITCNLKEWDWIFKKRCSLSAHPQMREIMVPLMKDFCKMFPDIFNESKYL